MPDPIPDMPAKVTQVRGGLGNVLEKLEAGKPVAIVYFGTSITRGSAWLTKNVVWFKKTFPKAEIKAINAAIGATSSDLGVFRVQDHVLKHKPDLVFIEFSINDGGNLPQNCRNIEGIVRQIWNADPRTDLCLVHMFRPSYSEALKAGKCTKSQSSHEIVADYYGIPSINAALRVNECLAAGKLCLSAPKDAEGKPMPVPTGMTVYSIGDGVHPVDGGAAIIADAAAEALKSMFAASKPGAHLLKPTFVPGNRMENARMVPLDPKMLSSGWVKLDESHPHGKRFGAGGQYNMSGVWEAHQPGESIRFRFKGTQVALYDLRAPDAGQVTVTLDGQEVKSPVGYLGFSRAHADCWPCSMFIAGGLANHAHDVEIKISSQPPDRRAAIETARKKPGFDPKQFEGTFIRVARILVVGDVVVP
ncbi:MAG: SGNH/GDSL hydrolase family protein [Kiritimatiellae bacterium]|nr:SGNH/GDSL hydrolase family protein [Kiritimatiellia bacterium]